MKKIKLHSIFSVLLCLFSSFVITNCWAHAIQTNAANYQQLIEIVNNLPSSGNTLLILDDDDTLTMMPCSDAKNPKTCQYLGSSAWFDWQENLPDTSPDRVADSFDGLLIVNALLLNLNNMPYTEANVPMVLSQLTEQNGIQLIIETARMPENSSATVSQFKNLTALNNSNLLSLIDQHALKGASGRSSLAGSFQPCGDIDAKPVSYEQGVFYVAGQNKGEMLRCLLKRTQSNRIKNIVFMDDIQKNVDDVYQAFLNDNHYNVVAVHYTRLDDHKKAFTEGSNAKIYQQAAKRRWENVKRTLTNNLITLALPAETESNVSGY